MCKVCDSPKVRIYEDLYFKERRNVPYIAEVSREFGESISERTFFRHFKHKKEAQRGSLSYYIPREIQKVRKPILSLYVKLCNLEDKVSRDEIDPKVLQQIDRVIAKLGELLCNISIRFEKDEKEIQQRLIHAFNVLPYEYIRKLEDRLGWTSLSLVETA